MRRGLTSLFIEIIFVVLICFFVIFEALSQFEFGDEDLFYIVMSSSHCHLWSGICKRMKWSQKHLLLVCHAVQKAIDIYMHLINVVQRSLTFSAAASVGWYSKSVVRCQLLTFRFVFDSFIRLYFAIKVMSQLFCWQHLRCLDAKNTNFCCFLPECMCLCGQTQSVILKLKISSCQESFFL